ncbi:hypothetical protein [Acaryochloris sp. IP29b_bin.137]|uniref:hypothetical protein n=1 Tax=Acaryochloris sp. IP29b_bin.137 TaxID=2969217 RepID=UPI0026019411|nr:hypothetical protein [Acaryochloris sp. IP29b_bin.137]
MNQGVDRRKSHPYQPIGAYLVEAGLLTDAQVGVALADQTVTAMPFGEIVVARGWVKEQTIEFIMKRVVLPERDTTVEADMQDGLTRRQRPLSGQPPQSPIPNTLHEGVSWLG